MALREAEVREGYRQLAEGKAQSPLRKVHIDGHAHLGTVLAEMAPGVTLLCGVSGVGKTQFLRTMANELGVFSVAYDGQVPSVQITGRVLHGLSPKKGAAPPSDDANLAVANTPCLYIDTARECFDVLTQVRRTSDDDLEALRASAAKSPPHRWADGALRYILGREYEDISYQELDRQNPENGEPRTWFYHELTYAKTAYGPDKMSLGELAACVMLQALRRAPRGSIVLLDEPENFLSPKARQRLLHEIISWSLKQNLSVVLASHSPEIAQLLPPTSLRTIQRGPQGQGVVISAGGIPAQVSRVLGLKPRPEAVLLVEDAFAKALLEAVLARCAPGLRHHVLVQDVRGSGQVTTVASVLGPTRPGMHFLGVLDGDVRNDPNYQGQWLEYLPGSGDPEDLVMEAITADSKKAARNLNIMWEELEQAVAETEASDPHDQPKTVSESTGIPLLQLIYYTARWLDKDSPYRREVRQLIQRIEELLAPE
ncbi:AAA family ATPase [Streptomyces phaeochromogenes]